METNASSGREVRWLSAVTGEPRSRCARALDRVGGLQGLLLQGPPGVAGLLSDRGARRLTAALRLHRRWSEHARVPDRRPPVLQPADVAACLGPRRRGRSVECFWVLGLDARSRLLAVAEVARGTVSACLVHPRECFWPAVRMRASSIVLAHNHPSGDPEPSSEDRELTERLVDAGQLLGIPVVDHVIVTPHAFRSVGFGSCSAWAAAGNMGP